MMRMLDPLAAAAVTSLGGVVGHDQATSQVAARSRRKVDGNFHTAQLYRRREDAPSTPTGCPEPPLDGRWADGRPAVRQD